MKDYERKTRLSSMLPLLASASSSVGIFNEKEFEVLVVGKVFCPIVLPAQQQQLLWKKHRQGNSLPCYHDDDDEIMKMVNTHTVFTVCQLF